MIKRCFAWVALAACVWLAVHYSSKWHSPWAMPASPVLSQLPALGPGCGKDCK